MKQRDDRKRVLTDDIYRVSAADLADKIIERIQRDLDPILLGSTHNCNSVDSVLGIRVRRKLD